MRIAINCIFFTPKGGGIKEYIYSLVTNLRKYASIEDYIFYILRKEEYYWINTFGPDLNYKLLPRLFQNLIFRSLFQSIYWRNEEKNEKFDVFHSPFFYGPALKKAKLVLTVHDLRFMRYPRTYNLLRYVYLRFVVPRCVKRSKKIIAVSEFTKKELIHFFKVPPEKVKVIHEAVTFLNNQEISQKPVSILRTSDFILSVGHIEPRKNYYRLAQAFAEAKKELGNIKLVIVGQQKKSGEKDLRKIQKVKDIIYLGFVSRDELNWLYANCLFFVFPSFYEGFGFPPLEAAKFGKMTLASKQSSIPEICGDGSVYVDPFLVQDIKKGLVQLLLNTEERGKKEKKAIQNLKRFSWEANTKATMKIYNEILKI